MTDRPIEKTVAAYQSGDRDAFRELVKKYQNLATSVAFARVGDLQRSEDIAQQAFLLAWQKRTELQATDKFPSWLRAITTNLSRNEVRLKVNQKERAKSDALDNSEPWAATESSDRIVSRREQSELLWSLVDHIPLTLREPLILYYREQKSVAKIASQMEISEQAVKQRLHRARGLLKRELENHVESLLEATRPAAAFSNGIMAALPLTGSALPGGATMAAATTKGGSLFSTVGIGGVVGSLGSLLGIVGGWWGVRKAVQQATSPEEESLLWGFFWKVVLLGLMFATLMVLSGTQANATLQIGLSIALVPIYTIVLIVLIKQHGKKLKRLHDKFGAPEFPPASTLGPLSDRGFKINTLLAVLGSWIWMVLLALLQKSWWFAGVICIVGLANAFCAAQHSIAARTPAARMRFQSRMVLWLVVLELFVLNLWNVVEGVRYAPNSTVYPIWIFNLTLIGMGVFLIFIFRTKAGRLTEMTRDSQHSDNP